MLDINKCDIHSLFALRYLLDKKNDVVNLEQDILDLHSFPERLNDSYEDEWRTYVKRALHKRSLQQSDDTEQLTRKLALLHAGKDAQFNQALKIINTAIKVNNSTDVTVISTPLRRHIENLLNI